MPGVVGWSRSVSADGTTVVLVTHDLSIAARTSRQLAMKDGALFEQAAGAPPR